LEIEDGTPWYASPNIKVFELGHPSVEVTPKAGELYGLKAIVRNNGNDEVSDATVRFYWANPAGAISRATTSTPGTAIEVGTGTASLGANGAVEEVPCDQIWVPTFVNDGHECLLAEAFHPDEDPLPSASDFNVPGDRHVAQRNIMVEKAFGGFFSFVFEVHNPEQEARSFTIRAEQGKLEQLGAFGKLFDDIITFEDGSFEVLGFTQARCPDRNELETLVPQLEEVSVGPLGRTGFALAGLLEGETAVVWITQLDGRDEVGGLGIVVHQEEKE